MSESGNTCADYWQETLYDISTIVGDRGVEGSPGEPLKFKVYTGTEQVALERGIPLRIGPIDRESTGDGPQRSHFNLSYFLYYSYGLARFDSGPGVRWPYHRVVPSARAFYPVEAYIVLGEGFTLPSGVYHYGQSDHALSRLRAGDLTCSLGYACALEDPTSLHVILTALFWKNAYIYRDYSYRLCTQEAGLVAGNFCLVGQHLGLPSEVTYCFDDNAVAKLLRLDDEEAPLLVLSFDVPNLAPTGSQQKRRQHHVTPPSLPVTDQSGEYQKMSVLDRDVCRRLLAVDTASRLSGPAEVTRVRRGRQADVPPPSAAAKDFIALDPGTSLDVDLAVALRQRNSGTGFFTPGSTPLRRSCLDWMLRRLPCRYTSDIRGRHAVPKVDCYIFANRVDGLEPGIYRLDHVNQTLQLRSRGMDAELMRAPVLGLQTVNGASAQLLIYLVASHTHAVESFGRRSYRIVNIECGLIAQRLCVLAGALNLSARIHNGYDAPKVEELLGLSEVEATPVFQIYVGPMSASTEYRMPIVF